MPGYEDREIRMRTEHHPARSLKALSDALKELCATRTRAAPAEPVRIVTAEASTGGLLAATLTEAAGSSAYFECGFNVYSNSSKTELLGVKEETLQKHGAVSVRCTEELAWGALQHSEANLAMAVSGISGPSGGSQEKPAGLTCITLALKGRLAMERLRAVRSPLYPHFDAQSTVLFYSGTLQFLFTGLKEAVSCEIAPRDREASEVTGRTAVRKLSLTAPDPQDYLIHRSDYALRAAVQEAAVREALLALCACLKGEPLLDYVEYINKVNFQDIS